MEEKKERLKALLDEYTKGNACLAFSGGIDSSLILKLAQETVSLETPVGSEEESHLADFIEDEHTPLPSDEAAFGQLKDDIRSVLDKLNEREQKVLRMRFGLDDGHEHTLEEVGQELNVTRERIRQIEAKAPRKLRQSGKSAGLEGYLNQ